MPLPRTLGEMAATLQVRLGFGAAGAAAGVNRANMFSMLFTAQTQLYWESDWKECRSYVVKSLGATQTLLDYPDEIHPERIKGISVNASGIWTPLIKEGIPAELYTTQTASGPPCRYELYADQIEFFPQTDQIYSVRIFGQKPLNRFTEENDETTLDPDLVFLYALANGKAHYKHSDAQFYADQLSQLLSRIKASSFAKKIFDAPRRGPTIINPRPLVVGRDI